MRGFKSEFTQEAEDIHQDGAVGGAVWLLLSGGWLPVMSGLQTINDDI